MLETGCFKKAEFPALRETTRCALTKEVKIMKNPVSETKPETIPKVLLKAKEEASTMTFGKEKPWDKTWENGPWDKGHWANRK